MECLTFEDALEKEEERVRGELEKIKADENYFSFNNSFFSYLSRGLYARELKRWMEIFPREQFFISSSEEYYRDPDAVYQNMLDFLKIPPWSPRDFRKYNVGKKYDRMKQSTRKDLVEYFRPHNQELYRLLGREFDWDV